MKRVLCFTLVFLLLASPAPAHADAAPPLGPPGANPGPGNEGTQVRMVAETVLIEVLQQMPAGIEGRARVTADFTMRNLGTQAESMAARFPISCNNGYYEYPEVQDLRVAVDGRSAPTRRIEGPERWGGEVIPWAEFDVTFPPGQDVQLRITYTLDGSGERSLVSFYYLLETGAGWKDTIGSADLIVRLPYPASLQNLWFSEETTGFSRTSPGGVISGNEVRWQLRDFEPTNEHNLEITLVRPSYWQPVLAERQNVAQRQNDGEAWGRLGRAYKDAILMRKDLRYDPGGKELYALGVEAYDHAVTLLPRDALWHAGFADLLAMQASWGYWYGFEEDPRDQAAALRAMQEIHAALALAPENARVQEIAEAIYLAFPRDIMPPNGGDTYTFLWLTKTPTILPPTATARASTPTREAPEGAAAIGTLETTLAPATPGPSDSATAALAPSPTSDADAAASNGLPCGSAVALPLALVAAARRHRR
jgi:hypothetical protein